MLESRSSELRRAPLLAALCALLAFAGLALWSAWVCDDAYITLRTVHNFVSGEGLRWNVAERVQSYTHPLWMFVLSAVYALTREPYFTTILTSLGVSVVAAVLLAVSLRSSGWGASFALVGLALSKASVDYATSGLENPLLHVWIGALGCLLASPAPNERAQLLRIGLVASLAGLTRLDALVLFAPVLAHAWWRAGAWRASGAVALAFAPLVLWELFSLVYYGTPFPNTALAKELCSEVPRATRLANGWRYLIDSATRDPLTLLWIASALVVGVLRSGAARALALGVGLNLLYIVWVGGDFMSGRFLTGPFFAATWLLGSAVSGLRARWVALLVIVSFGASALAPHPTWRSGAEHSDKSGDDAIADERGYYAPRTGLFAPGRATSRIHELRPGPPSVPLRVEAGVGFAGYSAAPSTHIVDNYALVDPLLARLPASDPDARPGHLERRIPRGYLRTLQTGENHIEHAGLARYYDKLALVVRGELWDPQRLLAIVQLNLGSFSAWRKAYVDEAHRAPHVVDARTLEREPRPGAPWHAEGLVEVDDHGTRVVWPQIVHPAQIELSVDQNDQYRVVLRRGDERVKALAVRNRDPQLESKGQVVHTLELADEVRERGFDSLEIAPLGGDGLRSLGHVRLR
ncbi:MAG: hypothetical protein JNN27_20335 [Planctomycetes bacterium]|nr:hypothetical protein [Planctomycetota bacterium]